MFTIHSSSSVCEEKESHNKMVAAVVSARERERMSRMRKERRLKRKKRWTESWIKKRREEE